VLVRTRQQASGLVEFAVEDSGEGIPAAHLGELFEPFFTTKANGLGMGLSITRSILELHGGEIVAQNLDQGGACVRCVLPPYGGVQNAQPGPTAVRAGSPASAAGPPRGASPGRALGARAFK
jgi:signal transduction histidine kinase